MGLDRVGLPVGARGIRLQAAEVARAPARVVRRVGVENLIPAPRTCDAQAVGAGDGGEVGDDKPTLVTGLAPEGEHGGLGIIGGDPSKGGGIEVGRG